MSWFDETFAPGIYQDHNHDYMLPALYGGLDKPFAMVVLEAPSISFTQERWPHGVTAITEAIAIHRQVFLNWVNANYRQRMIFEVLATAIHEREYTRDREFAVLNSTDAFFMHLYITDFWKCGSPGERRRRALNNCHYGIGQWQAVLAQEIKNIEPRCVILIGRHAEKHGNELLPPNLPRHCVPFPTWRNGAQGQGQLSDFLAEEVPFP